MRRQHRRELFEGAFHIVAERRARQRLEQRAAEVEGAQLGERETGREALEHLAVDAPACPPIVVGPVVVEREPGFFERLQVAPDRARRDAAARGERINRHPRPARMLDFAQDRPLPDDLGIAGHREILEFENLGFEDLRKVGSSKTGGAREKKLRRWCRDKKLGVLHSEINDWS